MTCKILDVSKVEEKSNTKQREREGERIHKK